MHYLFIGLSQCALLHLHYCVIHEDIMVILFCWSFLMQLEQLILLFGQGSVTFLSRLSFLLTGLPLNLQLVVSDHGMTESGNHGGSSYEETDSLALFIGPGPEVVRGDMAAIQGTINQVTSPNNYVCCHVCW